MVYVFTIEGMELFPKITESSIAGKSKRIEFSRLRDNFNEIPSALRCFAGVAHSEIARNSFATQTPRENGFFGEF